MADDTTTEDAAPAAEPKAAPAPARQKPEPAPADLVASIHRAVEAWMDTHVRNSPIARDTPAWNHLQSTMPALKDKLAQEIKGS